MSKQQIDIVHEVAGWFKIEATKPDGTKRVLADWFPNIITNGGLDRMALNNGYLQYCQVGSGSTTPAATDTTLVSLIGASSTLNATARATTSVAPYYTYMRNTYRFAPGTATGNLAEVGVGWLASSGLFSRALILDALGAPTTITVLPDETLDVTYEFRFYAKVGDSSGTITLAGVDYAYVLRNANVNQFSEFNSYQWGNSPSGTNLVSSNGTSGNLTDGAIGLETSVPTGAVQAGAAYSPSYVNGNYYVDLTLTWPLGVGNFAGGVGAALFRAGIGSYQAGFTPKIPKTAAQTLALTFRQTFARKTI